MKEKSGSTVDAGEVERFTRMADEWWNPRGKFAPLHRMNPLRIQYIRDMAEKHFRDQGSGVGGQEKGSSPAADPRPLTSLSLLDIGCGGGLIAEPMARLGARVTGIDAGDRNIEVAKLHAKQSGLEIDYRCIAAENLLATGERFDIVLALEIIEHVADVEAFVAAGCCLLKPGGLIVYSTLNRTAKSFALAIVGAEYVLRWLPRGTHDWQKFLRPHELVNPLRRNNVEIVEMTGMVFSPLHNRWRLDARDLSVNYMVAGRKC